MPAQAIIMGIPMPIMDIIFSQHSLKASMDMPSMGVISQVMPVLVMVQVIMPIIIGIGIMPPIIMGIVPIMGIPICGICIGIIPPIGIGIIGMVVIGIVVIARSIDRPARDVLVKRECDGTQRRSSVN
jgi:hypothetical protein